MEETLDIPQEVVPHKKGILERIREKESMAAKDAENNDLVAAALAAQSQIDAKNGVETSQASIDALVPVIA